MCDLLTLDTSTVDIMKAIAGEFALAGNVFTHYDVLVAARKRSGSYLGHLYDLKCIVSEMFVNGEMGKYSRRLMTLNIGGKALVYYPTIKTAQDHPLVNAVDESTDDEDFDEIIDVTHAGRLHVPIKMALAAGMNPHDNISLIKTNEGFKLSTESGNGSTIGSIIVNKDGRIRLGKRFLDTHCSPHRDSYGLVSNDDGIIVKAR